MEYAYGPLMFLGERAVCYKRGTPVHIRQLASALRLQEVSIGVWDYDAGDEDDEIGNVSFSLACIKVPIQFP